MNLKFFVFIFVSCIMSESLQFPQWSGGIYDLGGFPHEPYSGLYGGHGISGNGADFPYGAYPGAHETSYNPYVNVYPYGDVGSYAGSQGPDSYGGTRGATVFTKGGNHGHAPQEGQPGYERPARRRGGFS